MQSAGLSAWLIFHQRLTQEEGENAGQSSLFTGCSAPDPMLSLIKSSVYHYALGTVTNPIIQLRKQAQGIGRSFESCVTCAQKFLEISVKVFIPKIDFESELAIRDLKSLFVGQGQVSWVSGAGKTDA